MTDPEHTVSVFERLAGAGLRLAIGARRSR
jgi:hypothetical protein